MFHNMSKTILCDRRNAFASFSEDDFHVSLRAQYHVAWHAQHFRRVMLRVFLRFALSRLRQVVTKCKSRPTS